MNYLLIKQLHITCAVISGSLFVLRGMWMRITGIALKLLEHGVAEWALWQHAFDSVLQHTVRIFVL